MKRISFAFTSLVISSTLWAAPVTVTTFSPGTSISSSAMNTNLSNIVTAFNATNTGLYIFPLSAGINGQVLSTDGSGILSWISPAVQTFVVGTTGTAPSWSSVGATHTLNIPMASAGATAGLLSNSDWGMFMSKMDFVGGAVAGQANVSNGGSWI
jgi:hypothetical protein